MSKSKSDGSPMTYLDRAHGMWFAFMRLSWSSPAVPEANRFESVNPTMKYIASVLLATAFLLLPMQVAEAKTYGGFSVGQTFKMKVTKVTATKRTGYFGEDKASSVPKNLPKFRKNQTITFQIRGKGKLTAPKGISMPYYHSKNGENEYDRMFKRGSLTIGQHAEIKRSKGKPVSGELMFSLQDFSGTEPVFYTVIYKIRP